MIKIFVSVRNRLAISAKMISALKRHSELPHQLHIWDNSTSYKIDEHFMYWSMLYKAKLISQISFTTEESTFNAFSKAVAFNLFLLQHSQDPHKDKVDFLVCMDNDIIITPSWDIKLKNAWDDVNKLKLDNIRIISQCPGGIKNKTELPYKIGGMNAATGKFGGSGFWSMRSNFHKTVGLLDLSKLVGYNKKHDQMYWTLLDKSSGGKDYILGLRDNLAVHCGGRVAGSICNSLTKNNLNKNKLDLIKFEESEKRIDSQSFDEFYNMIINDQDLLKGW
jgi:hypothetical protein